MHTEDCSQGRGAERTLDRGPAYHFGARDRTSPPIAKRTPPRPRAELLKLLSSEPPKFMAAAHLGMVRPSLKIPAKTSD